MNISQEISILSVPTFTFAPSRKNNMTDTEYATAPHDALQERNVRARIVNGYGLVQYEGSSHLPDNMVEVDIQEMLKDKPQRKKAVMYLQLIRIVSGSTTVQNNSSVYQSYYKKNKKDGSLSSHYYRLMLFCDVTSKIGQVVYIVEGKSVNDRLWSRFPLLRDNGVVSIGTYITIINPLPITKMFCNEIPMIECRGGCFVMKDPSVMAEIDLDTSITNNVTRSFLKNNMKVEVLSTDVIATQCSGQLCDKQRSVEISRGNRACGCYSMHTRIVNLTLVHQISVSSKEGKQLLTMDDFSSSRFSMIYMKQAFSPTVGINQVDATDEYFKLHDCVDNVVEYINANGGFTVLGWYKRGEINDSSNDDSQNQVESSEMGYHVVSMNPTNLKVLDRAEFQTLKYDM